VLLGNCVNQLFTDRAVMIQRFAGNLLFSNVVVVIFFWWMLMLNV